MPRRLLTFAGRPRVLWAAVLSVILLGTWQVARLFAPADPSSRAVRYVTVRPGQSADTIAGALKRAGVIRSAWAFRVLIRFNRQSRSLKSGVYRLSPHDSLATVLAKIEAGDVAVVRVTIPEGFTVRQIVARLVAHHIGTAAAYAPLLRHPLPGMPAPGPGVRDPLEGYLFPATYAFEWGTTPRQALTEMWKTFQRRAIGPLYRSSRSHLTVGQWVTLASIVQREDGNPADAPKIAAVFVNRLNKGMMLQSDATVRYALAQTVPGGLTLADLTVASPYNTYRHRGLPPGPIANPGLVSLKAALAPARVPYLYFLALRSGRDLFAVTYAEHEANVQYANSHPGN